jgi:hypothetical protein
LTLLPAGKEMKLQSQAMQALQEASEVRTQIFVRYIEEGDNHGRRYVVGEESQGNVGGLVAIDLLVRVFSMGTNV